MTPGTDDGPNDGAPGAAEPWEVRADGTVVLHVHAQPGAQKAAVVGLHGGALKVKVAAPAEGGRANAALVRFVAADLGIPQDCVALISGATSRRKKLHLTGTDTEQLRSWIFGAQK